MNKKITVILLSLSILFFNVDYVSAATSINVISMTGTIFSGSPYLNPNNQNVYTIDFSGTRAIEIVREEYDENFSNLVERRVSNAHADGQPYAIGTNFVIRNHNAGYITTIYDANGSQIGRIQVVVMGRNGSSGGNDGGNGDCGCIVDIPGWGDHMAKLDEILAAIPSPPNWQNVANIFNNTIVPNLISQTSDMLGYAPSPPSPPTSRPKLKGDIPSPPKGNNAPGLTDSGFSANDLKNKAEKIEFREDPTGGFTILDPIGSLPTQEEFKDNIPNEPDMIPPEVPTTEAEAPSAPEEQENIAPSPPEVEAQLPSDPVDNGSNAPFPNEQEGTAPQPSEPGGTAPSPGEIINPLPGAPVENDNFAPQPGIGEGTTAPMPGNNDFNAPIPGSGNHQAPLPGEDKSNAPIPKESGKAPIPEGG